MSHIFISYAREDQVFTNRVADALVRQDLAVWTDLRNLQAGIDYKRQIADAITKADAFLYLFSANSANASGCLSEINDALEHNKRIIVLRIDEKVDEKKLPPPLSPSIHFRNCREGIEDFDTAINKILDDIQKDYDWIQYHAKFEVQADDWKRRNDTSLLLRGRILQEADQQIKAGRDKDPSPTPLQIQFISESLKAEESRQKTITRVSCGVFMVMSVLCMIAIAAGVYGNFRNAVAAQNENARATAEAERIAESTQRTIAEAEAEAQTKISRAGELAKQAVELRTFNPVLSSLLSVEAFKMADTYETRSVLFENAIAFEDQSIMKTLVGHQSTVKNIDFNLFENTLVSISDDGTAITWDISTGKIISTQTGQQSEQNWGVGLHGNIFVRSEGNRVELFDATTDELISHLVGHTAYVETIVFSPDNKTIATGSDDKTVILWDVYSGEIIVRLTGHTGRVFSVAFSSDGKKLASGSEDGPVRIWNIESWSWMEEVCQHAERNIQMPEDTSNFDSVDWENYVRNDEWTRFFPGEDYRITCPQWPPENYRR